MSVRYEIQSKGKMGSAVGAFDGCGDDISCHHFVTSLSQQRLVFQRDGDIISAAQSPCHNDLKSKI